jgi:hypothetical protein
VRKEAGQVEELFATCNLWRKTFLPFTSHLAITIGLGQAVLHIVEMNFHPPGKSYCTPGMPILCLCLPRRYCNPRLVAEVYGVVWSASMSLRT